MYVLKVLSCGIEVLLNQLSYELNYSSPIIKYSANVYFTKKKFTKYEQISF